MEVCFKGSLKNLYNRQLTRNEWERIALQVSQEVSCQNDKTTIVLPKCRRQNRSSQLLKFYCTLVRQRK